MHEAAVVRPQLQASTSAFVQYTVLHHLAGARPAELAGARPSELSGARLAEKPDFIVRGT